MFRPSVKNRSFDWMGERFSPMIDRNHFLGHSSFRFPWHNMPPVNIKEDGNIFEMEVSVPGFSKEDLEISVTDDILTIKGEKKGKVATEKNRYILEEFALSAFERRFRLAEGIGKEKVEAHYDNGMLVITFIDVPVEDEKKFQKVVVN